jgi:hypothetical protein
MPASASARAKPRLISGSLRRLCGRKSAGSVLDAGLGAATRGGDYDKARACANERLERARLLPYETVRDGFPVVPSTPGAGGAYTSSELAVPESVKLPAGATYTVAKRNFETKSNTAPFRGVVVVRGAEESTGSDLGTSSDTGNTCVDGFVNATSEIKIAGTVRPSTSLEVINRPGFYGVRTWSWRELYE